MANGDGMPWFIARVRRNVHQVIEEFNGYYPTIERWTKPSRKRKPVISKVPILPRTVIIDMVHYHDAMARPTIRGPVRFNKRLLLLTEEDIIRLGEIENSSTIQRDTAERPTLPEFNVGDRIRVVSGCLIDKNGMIEGRESPYYYRVLLDGANFPIIIDGCILSLD